MTFQLVEDVCVVCDEEGDLTSFHGLDMHEGCAPSHWVKDRSDLTAFQAAIERKQQMEKP